MSTPPPGISHREFLERALASAGEWARFADPKILGVLVLLGLGVSDLVEHAGRLLRPHEPASARCDDALLDVSGHSCGGLVASAAFVAASVFAGLTVICVARGLFPRIRMRGLVPGDHAVPSSRKPIVSRFFFGEVARHGSQSAYVAAVRSRSETELLDDLAGQVYEISKSAATKHKAAQQAFVCVVVFLFLWATARIALSVAS